MKAIKPSHRRVLLFVIIPVILVLISLGIWYFISQKYNTSNPTTNKPTTNKPVDNVVVNKPVDKVVRVAAMGDMLAHDTIIKNARTDSGYDFAKYFANIRPSYNSADVIFCNQEGLSSGETYGISGYPSFNAPTKFATDLNTGAGCNLINLANNHIGDKGVAATNATIDVWSNIKTLGVSGVNKSAEDQNKVSYATIKDIKLGYVSFADFSNNTATPSYSVNIYHDEALVRKLVTEARTNSDVVIVSMHWGIEDSNTVDSEQLAQVNLLASLGVDVIIGTGPHVLQEVETVARPDGGKTVVWYSLGNMLSSQLKTTELIGGIAGFDITKTEAGVVSVSNLSFTPTYMHYEWTAAEEASSNLLARKNAMIYLLKNAAEPLSRSLLGTTVDAQFDYVTRTLGAEVTINK